MAVSTEAIWNELHTGLQAFIGRRVRDPQSAEDILQVVFLKVHLHIASLRQPERVRGWIYQIARNAIRDYYRAGPPARALPAELAAPEDEEEEALRTLAPSVRELIACLPPPAREALLLTEFGGLSQQQLADQVGISLSGAKSRVQRARAQLKGMLLDCCHFEFDRQGRILDYYARCCCCTSGHWNASPGTCGASSRAGRRLAVDQALPG